MHNTRKCLRTISKDLKKEQKKASINITTEYLNKHKIDHFTCSRTKLKYIKYKKKKKTYVNLEQKSLSDDFPQQIEDFQSIKVSKKGQLNMFKIMLIQQEKLKDYHQNKLIEQKNNKKKQAEEKIQNKKRKRKYKPQECMIKSIKDIWSIIEKQTTKNNKLEVHKFNTIWDQLLLMKLVLDQKNPIDVKKLPKILKRFKDGDLKWSTQENCYNTWNKKWSNHSLEEVEELCKIASTKKNLDKNLQVRYSIPTEDWLTVVSNENNLDENVKLYCNKLLKKRHFIIKKIKNIDQEDWEKSLFGINTQLFKPPKNDESKS